MFRQIVPRNMNLSFKHLTIAFLMCQIINAIYIWSHQSDGGVLFGQYSARYAVALAGQSFITVAALVGVIQSQRLEAWLLTWTLHWRLVVIGIGIGILCVFKMITVEDRLWQAAALTVIGMAAGLLFHATEPISHRVAQRLWIVTGAVAVVGLLLLLGTALTKFPFSPDEAHWADYAITGIRYGGIYSRTWLMEPTLIYPGLGWSILGYGWLLEHLAFDIRVGRVLNFVGYLLMLLGLWLLTQRLYGRVAAGYSLLFASGSSVFFPVIDYRQHHFMAAITVFSAYLIVAAQQSNRGALKLILAFLAGLLATLGMQVHAVSVVLIAGSSLYFALDFLVNLIRSRQVRPAAFGFAGGALIGSTIYVLFNIEPFGGLIPFVANLTSWRGRQLNFLRPLTWPTLLEWVIGYGAIAFVVWRRQAADVLFGLWVILVVVCMILLDTQGYRTVLTPLFIVLVGAFLASVHQSALPLTWRMAVVPMVVIATLLSTILGTTYWDGLRQWWMSGKAPTYVFADLGKDLAPLIQDSDTIFSTQMLIWALPDHQNLVGEAGESAAFRRWGFTDPVAVWELVRPTIIIDIPHQMTLLEGIREYMVDNGFRRCWTLRVQELTVNGYRPVCPP